MNRVENRIDPGDHASHGTETATSGPFHTDSCGEGCPDLEPFRASGSARNDAAQRQSQLKQAAIVRRFCQEDALLMRPARRQAGKSVTKGRRLSPILLTSCDGSAARQQAV